MKAFKYILFLLLIVIIGTAIYITVQPNSFEVTRTRTIKAPAAVIYDNVIDFKNWEAWSSWAEADSDMKITLAEQTKGVNGSYSWEDKDGIGTMTNIKAEENKSITQEMQFAEFPKSDVSWSFKANDDGSTDATWTISGKDLPFGFKAFAIFTGGMENQIAPHYERSLEKLDSIVISDMKKYSVKIGNIEQHGGGYYLYNTASCKITELADKIQEMLPKIGNYAMTNKIKMAGAPFLYYHKWDEENNAVMFSSCVPTTTKVVSNDSDILTGQLAPFKAVKTTLKGHYDHLKEAWGTTMKYIPENGLKFTESGPMLEIYLTDPKNYPNPADWVTEIYIAVN